MEDQIYSKDFTNVQLNIHYLNNFTNLERGFCFIHFSLKRTKDTLSFTVGLMGFNLGLEFNSIYKK